MGALAAVLLQIQLEPALFFEEKIRPTLAARCIGCHGDARVSGLRLDSREGFLMGGRRGPAMKPGDPESSLFLQAVSRTHEHLKMPPGEKLPESEIAALRSWVAWGAAWPEAKLVSTTGKITDEHRRWWAFRPLSPPAWAGIGPQAIDRIIDRARKQQGLHPAAKADARTLIRRLSFDLTGLPPKPDAVEEFVRNPDVAALAGRLLDSPHFGERWGRYWLDVARYAEDDVLGLSQQKYPNAWRYRDWVVDAFNRDVRYDTFLKAQIAGDVMEGDYSIDLRPGLGFFGLGPWQYTVSPPPQARADERHDRIDVVTRGFLGLTVACARCHDHKFDPITTRDYYGLAGVFASTEYREFPLALPETVEKFEEHQRLVREKEKEIREFTETLREQVGESLLSRTAAYLAAARGGAAHGLSPLVVARWKAYLAEPVHEHPFLKTAPAGFQEIALGALAERKQVERDKRLAVERTRPKEGAAKTRLPNGFETYDEFCPGCDVAVRAIDRDRYVLLQDLFQEPVRDSPPSGKRSSGVLFFEGAEFESFLPPESAKRLQRFRSELEELKKRAPEPYAFLHAVGDKQRTGNLRIALRGDPYSLGEETPRRFLEVLSGQRPPLWTEGSGRLALAEAIAAQPLAARVMANRLWMWLFGRGIVTSPSNFGKFGDRPTHPELLEYLAWRLTSGGWSMKSLIREMVLTSVYQQSSAIQPENEAIDGANKWYWRANRKRLDAEALRDAMLAVSGTLDATIGGPSVELTAESRRRTIYGIVSRFRLSENLQLFDFPNPSITAEKRVTTHVPLQRLWFLNNQFVVRQAAALTDRAQSAGATGSARLDWIHPVLFGRTPSDEEKRLALEFLGQASWTEYAQVLLSSNEFLFVD